MSDESTPGNPPESNPPNDPPATPPNDPPATPPNDPPATPPNDPPAPEPTMTIYEKADAFLKKALADGEAKSAFDALDAAHQHVVNGACATLTNPDNDAADAREKAKASVEPLIFLLPAKVVDGVEVEPAKEVAAGKVIWKALEAAL